MSKIQERAMIVGFHQGKWGAKVQDKEAEAHIKNLYQSKGDVGTFYKKLMPDYVKDINKLYAEAYKFHTETTVPYNDNGERFILNRFYFDYLQKMKGFQSKVNVKLQEMIGKYAEALKDDEVRMNKGFKQADYPTAEELVHKYRFHLDVQRIPDNNELFNDLEADEEQKKLLEEIKAEKDKEFAEKMETAMKSAWKRVYDVVKHMEKTLSNPNARVHSSVVDNINELLDILPQLNINNDPKMEELANEIRNNLANAYRVEVLRDSPHYRDATAKKADEILKKMEGYL